MNDERDRNEILFRIKFKVGYVQIEAEKEGRIYKIIENS
jgi:hypothetical protein